MIYDSSAYFSLFQAAFRPNILSLSLSLSLPNFFGLRVVGHFVSATIISYLTNLSPAKVINGWHRVNVIDFTQNCALLVSFVSEKSSGLAGSFLTKYNFRPLLPCQNRSFTVSMCVLLADTCWTKNVLLRRHEVCK